MDENNNEPISTTTSDKNNYDETVINEESASALLFRSQRRNFRRLIYALLCKIVIIKCFCSNCNNKMFLLFSNFFKSFAMYCISQA